MVDTVDSATRSRMMAGIGPKDTLPEIRVRSYLHAMGLRFRLHDKRLPGCPDIVLPRFKAVIFVHGCFWHRHARCRFATTPSTNVDFWHQKLQGNAKRDAVKEAALNAAGWRVIVVWECETQDEVALERVFWKLVACSDEEGDG